MECQSTALSSTNRTELLKLTSRHRDVPILCDMFKGSPILEMEEKKIQNTEFLMETQLRGGKRESEQEYFWQNVDGSIDSQC